MSTAEESRPSPAGPAIAPAGAVVREWTGRVPNALADAYVERMRAQAIPDYRNTPGNLAAFCLTRVVGKVTEVTMLTIWVDRDAIAAFAGDDISIARYYDFDRDFLMEMDNATIRHLDLRAGSSA